MHSQISPRLWMHYSVSLERGYGGDPPRRSNAMVFPNKHLLTGCQFMTNISTSGILWHLESAEICFWPGLHPRLRRESSRCSLRPSSQWGKGKHHPNSTSPLMPYTSRPQRLWHLEPPPHTNRCLPSLQTRWYSRRTWNQSSMKCGKQQYTSQELMHAY